MVSIVEKGGDILRRKRNQSKKIKSKVFKWTLLCSLLLFFVASSYGVFAFVKVKDAFERSLINLDREGNKSELREEGITLSEDPISILLLGIEDYSSVSKVGRADTQIVFTLDPTTKEMNMVTIPRDTRVYIENAGEYTGIHKINSAYTYGEITKYGSSKLQIETVEKLLNIPIDHFIALKFDGFRDIVNAVGGVNIDIQEDFWEFDFYDKTKIEFKQGQEHLTGEEALAFVRMRERPVNSIYSRDERQRQFLKAMIDQTLSAGTLFNIGEISDILGENIQTDLTVKEIYELQKQYIELKNLKINTLDIKGSDQIVERSSFYIPEENSLKEVSQKLRSILNLKENDHFVTNAEIVN